MQRPLPGSMQFGWPVEQQNPDHGIGTGPLTAGQPAGTKGMKDRVDKAAGIPVFIHNTYINRTFVRWQRG